MSFNLANITRVDFFVCIDDGTSETHAQVPVDTEVQKLLAEMFKETNDKFEQKNSEGEVEDYSPSQKYGAHDCVRCKLDSDFAEVPRGLLHLQDLPISSNAIKDLSKISYYFAKAYDTADNVIMGVRRAAQFKGVMKARLMSVVDNTLKLVSDKTFKLDTDFDYIVIENDIKIIRPSGFEFTGHLTESVKAAAPAAATFVMSKIPFLDLDSLGKYASKHPRAARYLAAIKARNDLDQISKKLLLKYCKSADVDLVKNGQNYSPGTGYEILFLEVLDRRLFTTELIPNKKERYEAPNRRDV